MRFTRFGITLERLEHRELELVRRWRNSDWVRPYMRFRDWIGPEDQEQWFSRLDPLNDWYFTARSEAEPFGLFHIKNVEWKRRCGEAGGFVGNRKLIGCQEPARATLALMDFAFLVLQLETLEARYRISLVKIVLFNEQLGYEQIRQDADGFVRARISAECYFKKAALLRSAAVRLYGSTAFLANRCSLPTDETERRRNRCADDFQLQFL